MATRQFRPRLIATIGTAAFCVATIAAGFWQIDRADQKFALQRAFDAARRADSIDLNRNPVHAEAIAWRPVRARGEFLAAATVYIDNRIHQGTAGFHVVTPLRLIDSRRVVLVNRGWMPIGPVRHEPSIVPAESGISIVEGLLTLPHERPFELGTFDPTARVWPNLTIERFTKSRGIAIEPFVVLQTSDAPDGLIRAWEPPTTGREKNQSYALQWFSFAALALVLYVVLNLRKRSNVDE
ncbi:MAG: SURF1 family protein [Burkholderiales bacterium]